MSDIIYDKKTLLKTLILVSIIGSYIFTYSIPDPSGYQVSIYRDVPTLLWGLFSLSIILFLIYSVLYSDHKFLLVVSFPISIFVILLPRLIGYYRYLTGDSFIHVGKVRAILGQGGVPDENRYPSLHILSAIVKEVVGIQVETLPILITIAITSILLLGGFILSQRVFDNSKTSSFVFGLFVVFFLSRAYYNYAPYAQSNKFFIIFVVFVFLLDSFRSRMLMLAFLTASIPFHPLTSLILILMLVLVLLDQYLYSNIDNSVTSIVILYLYSSILFLLWITSSGFRPIVRRYSAYFLGYSINYGPETEESNSSSFFGRVIETITEASPQLLDLLTVFVTRFGVFFFIIGLSLILLVTNTTWKRDIIQEYRRFVILPLLILWGLGTIAIFFPLPFGFTRFYGAALIFALIVIGYEYSMIEASKDTQKRIVAIALVFILVLLVPLSVGTTYYSTWEKRPNSQALKSEFTTAEWIHSYGQSNRMYSLGMSVRRFTAYLYGFESTSYDYRPPPHFIWNDSPEEVLDTTPVYMIISPPARITYPVFYPDYKQRWDYTPSDFQTLQERPDLAKIYDAGNVTIYNLHE